MQIPTTTTITSSKKLASFGIRGLIVSYTAHVNGNKLTTSDVRLLIVVVDCFYIALFSALEQTHCTRM